MEKWILNRCKQPFRSASFDLVFIIIKTDLEIVIESDFSKKNTSNELKNTNWSTKNIYNSR